MPLLDNNAQLCYNTAMNGYDFDDTIYRGNSTRRFYFFCMLRLPYLVIMVPVILIAGLLRGLRILSKNKFLHMLEWYIALVPNAERFAVKFWDKNIARIKPWYLAQKRDDDIVISASPNFIIAEACRRLGVQHIATDLDTHARLRGKHCYGAEKVVKYQAVFGDTPLATYYSDSLSDAPMFRFAEKGYFVDGNNVLLLYENGRQISSYSRKGQIRLDMSVLIQNGYYNLSDDLQRKLLLLETLEGKEIVSPISLDDFCEIFSKTTYSWDFKYDGNYYWIANGKDSCEICCEDDGNNFWQGFETPQELFECTCLKGKSLKEVYDEIIWIM